MLAGPYVTYPRPGTPETALPTLVALFAHPTNAHEKSWKKAESVFPALGGPGRGAPVCGRHGGIRPNPAGSGGPEGLPGKQ